MKQTRRLSKLNRIGEFEIETDVGKFKLGELVYFSEPNFSRKSKTIPKIRKGQIVLKSIDHKMGQSSKLDIIGIEESKNGQIFKGKEECFFHTLQEAIHYQLSEHPKG